MLPDQFWQMTFREFYYYSTWVEAEEEREWNRQAVMMSLHANMNAGKGKRYSPDDFNPFTGKKSKSSAPKNTEDVQALRDRILARGKRNSEN